MTYDYKKMFNVSEKHAIVTGDAQGLSRGMAEGFLENGCKAVLVDIQKEKLKAVCEKYHAMGYETYEACGSPSDRAGMNRIFTEAVEILDRKLNMLIPVASAQRRHLPEGFPIEGWDLVLNINLNAVLLMIRRALKIIFKQTADGKVITIGSMVTQFRGTTVPAYTVSKGTISQLAKSLAVDCAGCNISVNCICPRYMDTEMCANMTQEQKDEYTVRIPTGRRGTPEDLKGPVLFPASSVPGYSDDTTIPVDGGYLVR